MLESECLNAEKKKLFDDSEKRPMFRAFKKQNSKQVIKNCKRK